MVLMRPSCAWVLARPFGKGLLLALSLSLSLPLVLVLGLVLILLARREWSRRLALGMATRAVAP